MEPNAGLLRPWVVIDVSTDELQPTRLRHDEFDPFYSAHWNDVYRPLAITLRNPDLAAEAVEEAMARAFSSWRTVQHADNPEGWVYRVALNWATSHLRKTRREVYGQRSVDTPTKWSDPDVDLFDALGKLDVKHRAVVVLRYLLDWSEADIAAALDLPKGTVKSRLHRALRKLREELT